MKTSRSVFFVIVLVMAMALIGSGSGLGRDGTMQIEGMPDDASGGRYDTQTGVFYGDVTAYEDALIRVFMNDTEIIAVVLEWHTKEDYMKATQGVTVFQNETVIRSDAMEYFGEEDEAHFSGTVRVELDDATFNGDRFVLNLETEEMQFFGSFSGEFRE